MGKMKNLAIDEMNLSSYEEYDLEKPQQGHINDRPIERKTPYDIVMESDEFIFDEITK